LPDLNPNDHFRLFIALSLPESVKDSLEQAQSDVAQCLSVHAARLTPRAQFHLTLLFLGNVAASRVDAMLEQLRIAARTFAPLTLSAEALGFFPNARFPRVLWAGVNDSAKHLSELWLSVRRATEEFTNEAEEKAFTAHVTLARLNRIPRADLEQLVRLVTRAADRRFGQWVADRVELMRSELSPQGARHSVLGTAPFTLLQKSP
jgi:2'-5' RNA ligase